MLCAAQLVRLISPLQAPLFFDVDTFEELHWVGLVDFLDLGFSLGCVIRLGVAPCFDDVVFAATFVLMCVGLFLLLYQLLLDFLKVHGGVMDAIVLVRIENVLNALSVHLKIGEERFRLAVNQRLSETARSQNLPFRFRRCRAC